MATRNTVKKLSLVDESAETSMSDLQALQAQAKSLNAQIKAAKDALPKMSALDKVIARQNRTTEQYVIKQMAARVVARVRAGQTEYEATQAVMEFYLDKVAQLASESISEMPVESLEEQDPEEELTAD